MFSFLRWDVVRAGGVFLCFGLSACSLLQRDPRSGYVEGGEGSQARDFYEERHLYEEGQVREEMGWGAGRRLTDGERAALETRWRLKKLEKKLVSSQEKKQYYKLKGVMRSDGERIDFLSLPTVEARDRWARYRGLAVNEDSYSEEIAALIEKNDITLGMSQKAVTESWGDPDLVEVAGDPVYGNERWKYSHYVTSNEGFQKQIKIVYFEAGRVVGWESN